ncbi:phage/plasmid primase, P4 family [Alicyclobacillus macrosporangiidus]|uniref:Phage/plasmid primase, P4 family, C-terminal domain-containing protein n=1 Tax=Alicyclobacillus macrosporangiidus TaxID=392015 RepID=A0A1I7J9S5_9BACL|nr:phage/plasmid primase, P4 family [Alicyclobacillus macrosporangiidus]SFU81861.1 phage/plasmid primase, P4 family, C-terminal domain-containing protein [Alicyclobacillus macrosporangiidus]
MPRECKVCASKLRKEAEKRCKDGQSYRKVVEWLAAQGETVSHEALRQHMTQHVFGTPERHDIEFSVDVRTLREFLEAWFARVQDGHIEVRPIPNDRTDKDAARQAAQLRKSFPVSDIDALAVHVTEGYKAASLLRCGWYYGVCPRKTEVRRVADVSSGEVRARWVGGAAEDVAAYPGAWADIDDHGGDDDADRIEHAQRALEALSETGYPPTFVVLSGGGRGRHVYFRFTEPVDVDTGRRIVRKLAELLRSDPSIADPARVMRLPGTLHTKTSRVVPVSIEQSRPDAEYPGDEFEATLDRLLVEFGVVNEEDRETPGKEAADCGNTVSGRWAPVPLEYVADKLPLICARFAVYATDPNTVSEPVWHHIAGTLKSLNPAPALWHEWSKGYDLGPGRRYNWAEAQRKWQQNKGVPIKCATFERDDPMPECRSCPHWSKNTSPAMVIRRLYAVERGERGVYGAPNEAAVTSVESEVADMGVPAETKTPAVAVHDGHGPDFRRRGFDPKLAAAWAFAYRDRFIKTDPETGKQKFLEFRFVKQLQESFGLHHLYDTIYGFNGQYYQAVEELIMPFILRALDAVAPEWARRDYARDVAATLTDFVAGEHRTDGAAVYGEWDAEPYIVFRNGVLDLSDLPSFRLVDFNPSFKCTWQVNAEWRDDWNPSSQSDAMRAVDEYLLTTLPDDDTRQALLEYLGYSLCRFDTSQQRYALLYGGGRNGKGVMIRVLERLFAGFVETVTLQDLAKNRFATHRLIKAAVNLVGDLSGERLEDTETIKKLTGNDVLTGERKFHDAFSFRPRVKLWYGANELPSTPDPSYGFFRRPLVIPFDQRFEQKYGEEWEERLKTPEALSYWAWLGISHYIMMRCRDGKLYESPAMKAALMDYWKANDIVMMAIEDEIVEFGQDYQVPRELLHLAFEIYAKDLGRKSPGAAKLMERLRNAAPVSITGRRLQINGERVNVWCGVRLGQGGLQLKIRREVYDSETRQIKYVTLPITEAYKQMRGERKGGASA